MRKKKIKIQEKTIVDLMKCSQEALDSFGSIEVVKVNGDLNLYYCTGITKLPDGLRVALRLSIKYCTGLTELPDDLKVGVNMDIQGCTGLTKLPGGLRVGGYLNLHGCAGLTELPDDLQVGGMIWYNSETGFHGHEDEPGVIPDHLKDMLLW
jgi:hypothetical protein